MFNFFKSKKVVELNTNTELELELTALVLAYEVARSDGDISDSELSVLLQEIKKIAPSVNKDEGTILKILEQFSSESISFHEFIEDINKNFPKNRKLMLISFLWKMAYADSLLDVDEERLIRRIADLIHIKNLDVLRIKDSVKKQARP